MQRIRALVISICVLASCVATLSCDARSSGAAGGSGAEADGPIIVVSIYPVADLVRRLADGRATIHTLLPPGASPHGFELTPRDVGLISDADLLVVVGLGVDQWAEDAAKAANSKARVVRFADMVPLDADAEITYMSQHDVKGGDDANDHDPHDDDAHEHGSHAGHDHGPIDPHIWLDPLLTLKFVQELEPILADYLTMPAQSLRTRGQLLRSNIWKVHEAYKFQASRVPSTTIVTHHNAFDRMAERYGFTIAAHMTEVELAPGGEVPPQQIAKVIDACKALGVQVIYIEPQFPESAVRAIQEGAGVKVMTLDPIGGPNIDGYESWEDMMRTNLDVLVEGQFAPRTEAER